MFNDLSALKDSILISSFQCALGFSGYYMYSEASWPRKKGDKARLASGFISAMAPGDTACKLRFYYHMFGADIGSLNVYTRPCNGCAETLVYTRSGNIGNFWDRAEMVLLSTVPFQVRMLSHEKQNYTLQLHSSYYC